MSIADLDRTCTRESVGGWGWLELERARIRGRARQRHTRRRLKYNVQETELYTPRQLKYLAFAFGDIGLSDLGPPPCGTAQYGAQVRVLPWNGRDAIHASKSANEPGPDEDT